MVTLFLASVLVISIFGFLPVKKAEAASTGWVNGHGLTVKLSTDRSGSYPVQDTFVGVTAEKTAAGGRVYYIMELQRYKNGKWYYSGKTMDEQWGYFSSRTPVKKFMIDNHLAKGESGTFRVKMELNSNDNWQSSSSFRGVLITPSFVINN